MSARCIPTVALLGKLGHGKTRIVNNVCGTHHVSKGGSQSATRVVELGYSKQHGIAFLGTPGLGPTEDVARHIAAQKLALEFTPLFGVYIVVRCGRDGDMIDDEVNDIIDMVGEEAIRIIVTHADVEADKAGFSVEDVKSSVSRLADVPRERIMVIGLDTSGAEIEEFVRSTLLSKPVEIKLDITEVVRLASGSKQSRRITKSIRDIYARIAAATVYCNEITQSGTNKNHENDIEIVDLQRATTEMVTKDRERVFKDAASLSIDEQTVCYAKAGAWLSLKLKNFVEASNTFLSWNVTDVSDPRNHYRACNHCGAVFVKVEGCDDATTCGAIPSTKSEDDKSKSGISFATLYSWIEDGKRWIVRGSRKERKRFLQCFDYTNSNNNATKPSTATLESGCGQSVAWSSMHPISPELVAALGKVEQVRPGKLQELSSQKFEIEAQEEIHRQKLQRELK